MFDRKWLSLFGAFTRNGTWLRVIYQSRTSPAAVWLREISFITLTAGSGYNNVDRCSPTHSYLAAVLHGCMCMRASYRGEKLVVLTGARTHDDGSPARVIPRAWPYISSGGFKFSACGASSISGLRYREDARRHARELLAAISTIYIAGRKYRGFEADSTGRCLPFCFFVPWATITKPIKTHIAAVVPTSFSF